MVYSYSRAYTVALQFSPASQTIGACVSHNFSEDALRSSNRRAFSNRCSKITTLFTATRHDVEFTEVALARGVPFFGDSVVVAFSAWLDSLAERGPTAPHGGAYAFVVYSDALDSPFPGKHPRSRRRRGYPVVGKRGMRQWPHTSSPFRPSLSHPIIHNPMDSDCFARMSSW